MSKCKYKFKNSELYKWLIEYLDEMGDISNDPIKVKLFIDELYHVVKYEFDMISLPNDSEGCYMQEITRI